MHVAVCDVGHPMLASFLILIAHGLACCHAQPSIAVAFQRSHLFFDLLHAVDWYPGLQWQPQLIVKDCSHDTRKAPHVTGAGLAPQCFLAV